MTSRVAVIVKIVLPDQGMVEVRILKATRTTIEIRDQVGVHHQLTAETNNLFRTKHPQVEVMKPILEGPTIGLLLEIGKEDLQDQRTNLWNFNL